MPCKRGHPAAGRHGRGRHRRQYRHRPHRRRQCAGLPHRHRHPARRRARRRRTPCACSAPSSSRCRPCPTRTPTATCTIRERLAEALAKTEPNGAIWANQWDNTANRQAHIETTAEEIWADTDGKVDGFVSAVGSGGTLGGVSDGLKAKRKDIQIALADVPGAALYSYYTTGVLKSEGSSITEGIGQGRITKNIEGAVVDRAYLIPDAESVAVCFQLLRGGRPVPGRLDRRQRRRRHPPRQGAGARPHHRHLLCDYGTRYQSKLFNPAFLKSKNLPRARWLVAERAAARCSSPRMYASDRPGRRLLERA